SAPQLISCLGLVARTGLSLTCNRLRSHAFPFQGQCSRPDASRPCQLLPQPVRPFGSATDSGSPQNRRHLRFKPVAASSTSMATASPVSTPLRDCYLPRD